MCHILCIYIFIYDLLNWFLIFLPSLPVHLYYCFRCTQCKNQHNNNGICVVICSSDYIERGSGNYNRRCEAMEISGAYQTFINSSHFCNTENKRWMKCRNSKKSICLDYCLENYTNSGPRRFSRRCEEICSRTVVWQILSYIINIIYAHS